VEPRNYPQPITKARLAAQALVTFSFALSASMKSFGFASHGICSEVSRYYTVCYIPGNAKNIHQLNFFLCINSNTLSACGAGEPPF
jgi:hypothetical protein